MLNRIALVAAFTLCVSPAFARDDAAADHDYAPSCTAPVPPALVDGAATTKAQLDAAHEAVDAFMSQSDRFQRCLGRALGARQDLAFSTHSNVPVVVLKQINGRAEANQRQKEQVGKDYNAAVKTFQAKNGTP